MCGCLSGHPYWGPGLQPRHVFWLGIEPATLWFIGGHSVHWVTPARAFFFLLVFMARSYGGLSSRHWNPGLGGLVWDWDALFPSYPSWIFMHQMWMWYQPLPCLCVSYLDGYGFFSSIVVRLPFNSISDSSGWWLFYSLVVILMWLWLCEETSHVCLCLHLDQKLDLFTISLLKISLSSLGILILNPISGKLLASISFSTFSGDFSSSFIWRLLLSLFVFISMY